MSTAQNTQHETEFLVSLDKIVNKATNRSARDNKARVNSNCPAYWATQRRNMAENVASWDILTPYIV